MLGVSHTAGNFVNKLMEFVLFGLMVHIRRRIYIYIRSDTPINDQLFILLNTGIQPFYSLFIT